MDYYIELKPKVHHKGGNTGNSEKKIAYSQRKNSDADVSAAGMA
ncbi:MAG: hypothetical protein R3297_04080 [Desulfobulbales bacterium]|nr:hypothetical protein [Desulfobulbales bacterium]